MTFLPLYEIEFTNSCRNEVANKRVSKVVKLAVNMNKYVCGLFCIAALIALSAAQLQCYLCNPVSQECEDNKADVVTCGEVTTSRCSRQVKKDATDKTKALRKCVIVDSTGKVSCPNGYDCFNCNKNLCNANPIITTTAPDSAFSVKCGWISTAAVFAILYL